jgi:hypothetical protein
MPNKSWEELTLDEKHNKILQAKKELDSILEQYDGIQVNYINAVKNAILPNFHSDNDIQKNINLTGVGVGYVTKSGFFRKYENGDNSDFTTNLGIYGDDCPTTLSKTNLPSYSIASSGSDVVDIQKDDNSNIKLRYNKTNNEIKEGQNCKLNYYENVFVYNVDESKYSSYEGCLKPKLPETNSADNSVMFHKEANSYDDCINATTVNTHKYFSLSRNQDNTVKCVSYKDYPDMELPNSDTINYDSTTGKPERSISEQTITLFDNSESAFKNTTNLFKKGYKSSVFGVFTTTPEEISKYAIAGDHCFLKLSRNGNLKIYRIGKTGDTLKNKSLEFFNIHLGNVKDSNNKTFNSLGDCDEEIGGYLDENSINVEWGKKCKAAGCFIYQDKGCAN